MFSFFGKAQDKLDSLIAQAYSTIRYNQLYQQILWDYRPTNEYIFDQEKGTITYITDDPNISAIAVPKVLGTFNLDDKTFLWADKNSSIQKKLSNKVEDFRKKLPRKYQQDKFVTNVDFSRGLLAYFSAELGANGFDLNRQGRTIIYFALMQIDVYEGKKIKYAIKPEPHFDILQNDKLMVIEKVKEMHQKQLEINHKFYNLKELSSEDAFKAIREVHLKYWLNEDQYYFPALGWPCNYDQQFTSDWAVIKLKNLERFFVVYNSNQSSVPQVYGYEIQINGTGQKIIIGSY